MQDVHSIAGGRIFVGGGGGGAADRRLRLQQQQQGQSHHQAALKCPRCDSINTKFCYYNNYNLSQPRHFCKNCRRYWTKGGVLRNVPVGGGCRKTKRSKPKSSAVAEPAPADSAQTAATTTIVTSAQDRDKSSSHSSSESSSLTATTIAAAAAAEAVSATSSITPSGFFNVAEFKSMVPPSMDTAAPSSQGFEEQGLLEQSSGCGLFANVGGFSSLMASSAEPLLFGFSSVLDQTTHWSQHQDQKIQQPSDGGANTTFFDQTVPVDLPALQGRTSGDDALAPLDWQPAADQGLFDLPGTVDHSYWSHNSQWADPGEDHHQYLP